jgi:hypothetical protein
MAGADSVLRDPAPRDPALRDEAVGEEEVARRWMYLSLTPTGSYNARLSA